VGIPSSSASRGFFLENPGTSISITPSPFSSLADSAGSVSVETEEGSSTPAEVPPGNKSGNIAGESLTPGNKAEDSLARGNAGFSPPRGFVASGMLNTDVEKGAEKFNFPSIPITDHQKIAPIVEKATKIASFSSDPSGLFPGEPGLDIFEQTPFYRLHISPLASVEQTGFYYQS
jgi:hypothetical protein